MYLITIITSYFIDNINYAVHYAIVSILRLLPLFWVQIFSLKLCSETRLMYNFSPQEERPSIHTKQLNYTFMLGRY
jgi:hypothetical protein